MDWTDALDLIEPYRAPLLSLLIGVVLFALAPRLAGQARGVDQARMQAAILRVVLGAFIALQIVDLLLHRTLAGSYDRLLLKASVTLALVYASLLIFNTSAHFMDSRFGRTREIDGKTIAVASYHSRMASLIMVVVLCIFGILALIEIWDMGSLIERTGFIGVIAAFVVLTNAVWFPDLYHGLALLGSSMAEEGDTIQLDAYEPLYIINRLTPFYALLLNVDTNERVILRNARLFDGPIENLNKRASVEGLRRRVDLKVSYPPGETQAAIRERLLSDVDKAVSLAFERLQKLPDVHVNSKVPFVWLMSDAGDSALHFSVCYHLAALPETKLTKVVRSYVRRTPSAVTLALYQAFSERGLHLATPDLVHLTGVGAPAAPERPAGKQTGEGVTSV